MNKERLVNNKYRKQEFEKRRNFGGAESFCNAYECCIFQNLLLEKDELENKINKVLDFINAWKDNKTELKVSMLDLLQIEDILRGEKNE